MTLMHKVGFKASVINLITLLKPHPQTTKHPP
ncbi:MAG: hypothetical protein ACI94Y_000040, partial [Maribacter sp.]